MKLRLRGIIVVQCVVLAIAPQAVGDDGTVLVKDGAFLMGTDQADVAALKSRFQGRAIGLYRLWRDLGYVVGALFAGLLTDLLSFRATILIIALLLVGSSLIALVLLPASRSAWQLAREEV